MCNNQMGVNSIFKMMRLDSSEFYMTWTLYINQITIKVDGMELERTLSYSLVRIQISEKWLNFWKHFKHLRKRFSRTSRSPSIYWSYVIDRSYVSSSVKFWASLGVHLCICLKTFGNSQFLCVGTISSPVQERVTLQPSLNWKKC